jgi:hypothetical protein
MNTFDVKFAVYGALKGENEDQSQAADVSAKLLKALVAGNGIVKINNDSLGSDPSRGSVKHFAALVVANGTPRYFACKEGQKIDFNHSIPPTT